MNNTELIIILPIAGSILGLTGFVFGHMRHEAHQRRRVYERFDNHKEHVEEKYVRKDLCGVIHKQVSEDLREMKGDIKKLLGKNGIK